MFGEHVKHRLTHLGSWVKVPIQLHRDNRTLKDTNPVQLPE